ncbi:hypothetical protein LNTAR_14637 [Lentisphaera araneosa HTCC2155]|uniref:FecR protein domain-containing protein n=1 Tax=Lentisphaera araneosa HTCC2155 TaxID=313628 RepID=A6DHH9_9BACT|nr:LamG-like jellyroll fold domain-containing protein [Lentisphaera araneosa]EDM29062.1 hypothetical protein LNTAR_14637 [Lentisphaera araneosa HTCC2155]
MDVEQLADLYLRDELSEEQKSELKILLENDEEQSRVFTEYLYETGQLLNAADQLAEVSPQLDALGDMMAEQESKRNWFLQFGAMAALLIAAFAIFSMIQKAENGDLVVEQEIIVLNTPILARVHSSENKEFSSGQWLEKGEYAFSEKLALTLDSGVELNIETRSQLELIGPNKVRVIKGKVHAYVPQVAIGFVLEVPGGEVLDLGTEFKVAVDEKGTSDIEVMSGEVEVISSETSYEHVALSQGQSTRLNSDGSPANGQTFQVTQSLPNLLEQRDLSYVHWPFDSAQLGWTPTSSGGDFHDRFKAELKGKGGEDGPQFIEGAYGYALDFDGENDFAKTDFKGISGSRPRTVSFWVKIPVDAKQKENYSFVSWGNSMETGQKWQIGWNALPESGTLGAIRTEFKNGYVIGETDLRDGRWHHIVSLFIGGDDADVATHVRHYVDGRLEAVSGFKRKKVSTNVDSIDSKPVTFGRKMDGSKWYLRAKLDELYIIDAAITPGQVRRLMDKNSLY